MIAVNQELFNKLAQEEKPVLVDFWAPWCVYCRRIAPALERLAEQREDVIIGKVNIDEEPQLALQERIEVIPTLVLYKNGKALGSIVAPESKAQIDDFIRDTLAQ